MRILFRLMDLQLKDKHLLNAHPSMEWIVISLMAFWVLLIPIWQLTVPHHFSIICGFKVSYQRLSFPFI
jgi:hypothetical protein